MRAKFGEYAGGMTMDIAGDNVPAGMVGDRYETTLQAVDAGTSVAWSLADGTTLPAGLALDADSGVISGVPGPGAQGRTSFTVKLSGSRGTKTRGILLLINPGLAISRAVAPPVGETDLAGLAAAGGAPPYAWGLAGGSRAPDGLSLEPSGRITGTPARRGTGLIRVTVSDAARHTAEGDFRITVKSRLRPFRRRPAVVPAFVTVTPPAWWRQRLEGLRHVSNWMLATLGLGVPTVGAVWIFLYAFGTHGHHVSYVGVAMLAGLAAFISGCLAGFLFGIPKVVSSGQLRQQQTPAAYTPSSNLAEVSDWLTKLLLGAGLVQLTRLGRPIGDLIGHVSAGLYTRPADRPAALVLAGAVLFGYAFVGLLDGYVVTALWYQKRIANL
jgi:Putative Ig domain